MKIRKKEVVVVMMCMIGCMVSGCEKGDDNNALTTRGAGVNPTVSSPGLKGGQVVGHEEIPVNPLVARADAWLKNLGAYSPYITNDARREGCVNRALNEMGNLGSVEEIERALNEVESMEEDTRKKVLKLLFQRALSRCKKGSMTVTSRGGGGDYYLKHPNWWLEAQKRNGGIVINEGVPKWEN